MAAQLRINQGLLRREVKLSLPIRCGCAVVGIICSLMSRIVIRVRDSDWATSRTNVSTNLTSMWPKLDEVVV